MSHVAAPQPASQCVGPPNHRLAAVNGGVLPTARVLGEREVVAPVDSHLEALKQSKYGH